jgi:hypothetical protein
MIAVQIQPPFDARADYDDDAYAAAAVDLVAAMVRLVEAGAQAADVESELVNALSEAAVEG